MADDRITIFVPLKHFHEPHLRQCMASVYAQTRSDWEMVIVVDRENDGLFKRVLGEVLADPRVRLVHREGQRLAGSYNTAMRASRTEFVGALFGDDMWDPRAVEVLGARIRAHPEVDFFHTGRYFIDGSGTRLSGDYPARADVTLVDFQAGSPVKHLMCWRARRALEMGGVDESLINFASDDYDFPWSMMEHGAVFHGIPDALYVLRDHRDGVRLTTHVPRNEQAAQLRRILEKHGTPPALVRRRVREARRTYLRQSLFRNPLHRWFRERFGYDARRGWREPYK